jgi:lipopolysaccharide export system protein LptA
MTFRLLIAASVAGFLAAAPVALAQAAAPMFGAFTANTNDPIAIEAQALIQTDRDGQRILEYSGAVVATRGDMVIRADALTVYLPAEGGADGVAFQRIEASGNVTIVAGQQTAAAQRAVVDMVAQTVVMTGAVTVQDGPNRLAGQTLTVNLATNDWRLEDGGNQRVQTVITPPER